MHEEVKYEWLTISTLPIYKPHLDSYAQCVKRGVHVKVLGSILNFSDSDIEKIKLWKQTRVNLRLISHLETRFSIIDGKEIVIRISGEEKKYLAIWIKNKSLAESMKKYFMTLWNEAKSDF